MEENERYIPALSFNRLTPLFDPVIRWSMRELELKRRTFKEIYRVLRPGGELHILDFGQPDNLYTSITAILIRRLEEAADNVQGLLPEMMREAGFEQVGVNPCFTALFGPLALYRAWRPARD